MLPSVGSISYTISISISVQAEKLKKIYVSKHINVGQVYRALRRTSH